MLMITGAFCCVIQPTNALDRHNEFIFNKIGLYDGLPGSTVFTIHQDGFGFMWFGTREGLVRYDGLNIKTVNYFSDCGFDLTGKMITSIAEDNHGNLYIGIWESGLLYYNRPTGSFHRIGFHALSGEKISDPNVWVLRMTSKGWLLVGTREDGLFVVGPETMEALPFLYSGNNNVAEPKHILAIHVEGDKAWVADRDHGIMLVNIASRTAEYIQFTDQPGSATSLSFNCIFRDKQGRLWFGSSGQGLYYYDDTLQAGVRFPRFSASMARLTVRSITEDASENLFIGSDGNGLFVMNQTDQKIRRYTFSPANPDGISSNTIFTLLTSPEGSVWIGTNKGGVNVIHPQSSRLKIIEDERISPILSEFQIMSVMQDKQGWLWFGTDGSGIIAPSRDFQNIKVLKDIVPWIGQTGLAIKSIFEDSKQNLYFGSYGNGMAMLNSNRNKFLHFEHHPDKPSLSQNDVWDFAEDEHGMIWIATLNGGLNLFNPQTLTFETIRGLSDSARRMMTNILSLEYDQINQKLWIATTKGLFLIELQNNLYELTRPAIPQTHPLHFAEIKTLYLDKENTIWAGTRSFGAFRFDSQTGIIEPVGIEQGLRSNTIASVTEDQSNNVWIATSKGLSRYDKLNDRIFNYQTEDGLTVREYLSESFALLVNGSLIFGGAHGIDIIDPDMIVENNQAPKVYFTKLTVSNQELMPDDSNRILQADIAFQKSIRLRYFENTFGLEFIAPNFIYPGRISYATVLEGFDNQWNYLGNQHKVSYTNIDPGHYRLRVFASNEDGVWNQEGTAVEIIIVPPWWETVYARFAFLLIIISGFITFYILKNRSYRRRQQHLEVMVADRTSALENEKKTVEIQNQQLENVKEELIRQNQEILRQKLEIDAVCNKLQDADRLKLEFFTNISHEIRTPLTLMANPLNDLIKQYGPADENLLRRLKLIQSNQNQLLELMNQWLDFQKLEHEPMHLKAFPQDLVQFVQEVLELFQETAQRKNIRFRFVHEPRLPEIWFDAEKLQRVLYNLMANAFKFTPAGGEITVSIIGGEYAGILVEDNGIGIKPEELDRVFDSFYQTEQGRKTSQAGTGIGLSIVKKMVELHHGKINVFSELNKGTRFEVLLPVGSAHLKETEKKLRIPDPLLTGSEQITAKSPDTTGGDISQRSNRKRTTTPRILVVEDNSELRNYLMLVLSPQFQMEDAADGISGLKKALSHMPDLIISDVMMPEMDGVEMLEKLRSDHRTSHIPVILLTAKARQSEKIQGLVTGADDYIVKPFDYEELIARITNLLKNREIIKEKFRIDPATIPAGMVLENPDEVFLKKLNKVLEENFQNDHFNITSLVEAMTMSRSLLHNKLKQLTAMSASEYLRSYRLRKAAVFLSQEKLSVSEIAFRVGFSDTAYFIRCFRQQFGTTPGLYASSRE